VLQQYANSAEQYRGERLEVTAVDFVHVQPIRADRLSVFGVGLGDSLPKAKTAVQVGGLVWKDPELGLGLVVIQDKHGQHLFGFNHERSIITRIILYSGLISHLVGDSKMLLMPEILEMDSPGRLVLLGREDFRREENTNGLISTSFVYDTEGLRLIGLRATTAQAIKLFKSISGQMVHFIFPAKNR
jgi:hypothetical protein